MNKSIININFLLKLLLITAFLPPVISSVNLKAFTAICYIAPFLLFAIKKFNINSFRLNLPVLFFFILNIILLLSSILNFKSIEFFDFLSNETRILQVLIVSFILLNVKITSQIFHAIFKLFILILICNTFISILDILGYDLEKFKSLWFSDFSESVIKRANENGRFTGIISQPFEAGFAYSLSLLYIYFYPIKNKLFNFSSIIILIIGGFLSFSKIFIFICLPLILFQLFIKYKNNLKVVVILIITTLSIILFFVVNNFDSFQHLYKIFEMLLDFNTNPILALTGGRFSNPEGRGLDDMILDVFTKSPFWGFGLGSTKLMDNGFIEIFYQGGLISLLFYLIYLYNIYKIKSKIFDNKKRSFFKLTFTLFLLSHVGSPVLTSTYTLLPVFLIFHKDLVYAK